VSDAELLLLVGGYLETPLLWMCASMVNYQQNTDCIPYIKTVTPPRSLQNNNSSITSTMTYDLIAEKKQGQKIVQTFFCTTMQGSFQCYPLNKS